jgi:sulfonate transport system permease protein
VPSFLRRSLGIFILLGLWAVGSATGLFKPNELPGPVAIAKTFGTLLANGELVKNMLASLGRVAFGLSIGVVVGLVFAIVSGLVRMGENVVDAPMQMLRTLPILALAPIDILWFGIGNTAKIILIVYGVSFPIYLNTFAAIRGIDSRYIELAKTLKLSRWTLLRRVIVPGSLPGFLVGLRFAVGISWLILVVSEQINANSGIGYLMSQAQQLDQVNIVLVCLVVYGLLGISSDALVRFLERRMLTWRSTFSGN